MGLLMYSAITVVSCTCTQFSTNWCSPRGRRRTRGSMREVWWTDCKSNKRFEDFPLCLIQLEVGSCGARNKCRECNKKDNDRKRIRPDKDSGKTSKTNPSVPNNKGVPSGNSLLEIRIFFSKRTHDLLPHLYKYYSSCERLNRAISFKNRRH